MWVLGCNHLYMDLLIYFTGYVCNKSTKVLRLHCEELIGKAEEHEGKKYLTVNDDILDK